MSQFDATRRFTNSAERTKLLEAIFEKEIGGELHWLEWKRTYKWDKAEDLAKMARALIGFANRNPEDAALDAEGFAYLVVGLQEEGGLGIEKIDSSQVEKKLSTYLGSTDGPKYSPYWHEFRGQNVVVFEVLPPKMGDPIHVLRHGAGDFKTGQIFIRNGTATDPVTFSALQELATRSRKGDLSLQLKPGEDCGFFVYSINDSILEKFLSDQERKLTSDSIRDNRWSVIGRDEEFAHKKRVDNYLSDWRNRFVKNALKSLGNELPLIEISATNSTDYNFTDIEVKLFFPVMARVVISNELNQDFWKLMPTPPRSNGNLTFHKTFEGSYFTGILGPAKSQVEGPEIQYESERLVVTLSPFDLRPKSTTDLRTNRLLVFLPDALPKSTEIVWEATAKNVAGQARGSFQLNIKSQILELTDILKRRT